MPQYTPETPAEKLLTAARATEVWLAKEFDDQPLPASIDAMVETLRRYARRCRQIAWRRPVTADEADARVKRLTSAAVELLRAWMRLR